MGYGTQKSDQIKFYIYTFPVIRDPNTQRNILSQKYRVEWLNLFKQYMYRDIGKYIYATVTS